MQIMKKYALPKTVVKFRFSQSQFLVQSCPRVLMYISRQSRGGGGGGGGGAQEMVLTEVLYIEAPPQGQNPFPFIYNNCIIRVTLSYFFHRRWYPFLIPRVQRLLFFLLVRPMERNAVFVL